MGIQPPEPDEVRWAQDQLREVLSRPGAGRPGVGVSPVASGRPQEFFTEWELEAPR